MSTGMYNWSRTPASNANATYSMAEGMAPSAVNDGVRGLMSDVAQFRDDIAGAIVAGGTGTAYTVSSYQTFTSLVLMDKQLIAFTPSVTNTNTVGNDLTLNVDGLGAKPVRMQPSVALPSGTLVLGTPYVVLYNNSDAVFYLHNMTNPYNVPLAAGMDYWGSTAPNSSFAFPIGQAISRTTYATLFSLLSTTYGVGDGSTTFNLPDKTGRVSAMKEASASRLTSAVSGVDGGTLGSAGSAQSKTIAQGNLPNVNFTVTDPGHLHLETGTIPSAAGNFNINGLSGGSVSNVGTGAAAGVNNTVANVTGITVASGGSGTALAVVQPTIICNYIMRII